MMRSTNGPGIEVLRETHLLNEAGEVSGMRAFIIDSENVSPELQGGLIGVVGSTNPTAEEKGGCIEEVSRYALDGWAIAADRSTPIGMIAALTAEAACAPFVSFSGYLSAAVQVVLPTTSAGESVERF